mmetsp:Transcript_65381/g.181852  ORF Transcript_65381/g.181852 Transcript_65381/m.181852 type:complete len:626 (+) Transcript_65381:39-1916(+)
MSQSLSAPGDGDQRGVLDSSTVQAESHANINWGDGEVRVASEREIQFAELETRLRQHHIELLQPTIRKTTLMEEVVKELRRDVERTASMLSDLTRLSTKIEQQVVVVESFRAEMATWDAERLALHAQVVENMSSMKQDLDAFRYSLEREDTSVHSIQRTVDRIVGELQRLQESSDGQRHHVDHKLNQHGKLLNSTKTDLEVKFVALETKHNRLSDELWGETTGLTKVMNDLLQTDETVAFLSQELRRIEREKADVTQLHVVQEEVNSWIRDATSNVSTLKRTVDSMMGDVKEHFRTATNTVAAHSATMLAEVRSSYQEELDRSSKLRGEITTFMANTKSQIAVLEDSVTKSNGHTEVSMGKVQADIEEMTKLRRRDRANMELEHRALQEQVAGSRDAAQTVSKCLEHLSSVIWMMLQSERAASALSMQDDVDRAKVALVGFKDGKGNSTPRTRTPSSRPSTASSPLPPVPKGSRPKVASPTSLDAQEEETGGGPVISVDQRCLSCSGQAQTVLAGFKIACLNYAPGPVSFARKNFQRPDLLDLRQKLLDQANEALQLGPIQAERKDYFGKDPITRGRLGQIQEVATMSTGSFQEPQELEASRPISAASSGGSSLRGVIQPLMTAR